MELLTNLIKMAEHVCKKVDEQKNPCNLEAANAQNTIIKH